MGEGGGEREEGEGECSRGGRQRGGRRKRRDKFHVNFVQDPHGLITARG